MINYEVVKGLEQLFEKNNFGGATILSVGLNKYADNLDKNCIHVYDYNFKNCNTSVKPYGTTTKISTYKVYNNQVFQIFQLK